MYTVTKHIEFCYGHRLYQYPGKCGNLHGHNAVAEITCSVNELPENGMAVDFNELSKIGNWINKILDHRMILAKNDPMIPILKERHEDVMEIPVAPSAENLARLIFEEAKRQGFPVTKVTLWESSHNVATFEPL